MTRNVSFLSGLDARLEAVGHGDRRRVLFELRQAVRGGDERIRLDFFADVADSDAWRIALRHRHLPKLAEYGFVTVGSEGECIEPGPKFDDLLPLLDYLAWHEDVSADVAAASRC